MVLQALPLSPEPLTRDLTEQLCMDVYQAPQTPHVRTEPCLLRAPNLGEVPAPLLLRAPQPTPLLSLLSLSPLCLHRQRPVPGNGGQGGNTPLALADDWAVGRKGGLARVSGAPPCPLIPWPPIPGMDLTDSLLVPDSSVWPWDSLGEPCSELGPGPGEGVGQEGSGCHSGKPGGQVFRAVQKFISWRTRDM